MDEKLKQEIFEYLDDLRKSGAINMLGAAPSIQKDFSLTRKEARAYLMAWIKSKG